MPSTSKTIPSATRHRIFPLRYCPGWLPSQLIDAYRRFYVRTPLTRVATLRDRWCSPARLAQGRPGAIDADDGTRGVMRAACGGLLGRDAERFGMGPAVVLGQDLTEAAGPVRHGAVADLATG
jgi:hypothetical protein